MEIEVARCTGNCCNDFTLPFSPAELERWKRRVERGQKTIVHEGMDRSRHSAHQRPKDMAYDVEIAEFKKLFDMLIFKRTDHQAVNSADRKASSKTKDKGGWAYPHKGFRFHHYTCKHFDSVNKLCRNYENRPNMCRSYPDGGECNYRGCTRRCESKPINAEKMLKDEKLEEAIL